MRDRQAGTSTGPDADAAPSRDLSLARSAGIDGGVIHHTGPRVQIKFKNPCDHNDRLGPISVLEHSEPERLRAIDEQATAKMLLVLNNPVAALIPTDKEEARFRARYRRGRFQLAHDTSPSMLMWSAAGRLPGQRYFVTG
jgi:hypothetical protein